MRHASEIKLKFEATGDFRRRCFQELFRREFNKIDQFCSNQAASIRKRILTDTNQVSSQDLRKSL